MSDKYNSSLTGDTFLFHEMRIAGELLLQGQTDEEIKNIAEC